MVQAIRSFDAAPFVDRHSKEPFYAVLDLFRTAPDLGTNSMTAVTPVSMALKLKSGAFLMNTCVSVPVSSVAAVHMQVQSTGQNLTPVN